MTTETAPALTLKTDLFINGEFVPAASGKRFATVNPATGETIAEVAEAGTEDLDRAVAAARQAFESGPWAAMKPRQRGRILMRAADLLALPRRRVRPGRDAGQRKAHLRGRQDRHARRRRVPLLLRRVRRQALRRHASRAARTRFC